MSLESVNAYVASHGEGLTFEKRRHLILHFDLDANTLEEVLKLTRNSPSVDFVKEEKMNDKYALLFKLCEDCHPYFKVNRLTILQTSKVIESL